MFSFKLDNIFQSHWFYLAFFIVMNTVYIPIEGETISWLKVLMMAVASIKLFISMRVSKLYLLCLAYWLCCVCMASFHLESFRWATILYLGMFCLSFAAYYQAVHCNLFTQTEFYDLLKKMIYAYFVVMLVQQAYSLLGGGRNLWLNYTGVENKPNMLALEVSHAARTLSAFLLCIFRLLEIEIGHKVSLNELWKRERVLVCIFLYCMLFMGSGTSMMCLLLLSLYFVSSKMVVILASFFVGICIANEYIEWTPLNRAMAILSALTTDATNRVAIGRADGSAAYRVVPLMNTLFRLNLFSLDTWMGKGCDASVNTDIFLGVRYVSNLLDYGFLSYLLSIFIVLKFCVKKVFSLEVLFYVFLCLTNMSNVAWCWGIYMTFATTFFFQKNKNENSVCLV